MDLVSRAKSQSSEYSGVKRIALSYSGGLESTVIGSLLLRSGFQVFPVVVDMGQKSDFSKISTNAKKVFGSCTVADAKERFSENAMRALKANYGAAGSMNFGGISRPVLASVLAAEARRLKCDAIAHGSSGTGNDHLIMENALRVLAPEMRIIAPVRDLDLKRDEALLFAKKEKLPTNIERAKRYSVDENLWIRTVRQGAVTDPAKPLPQEVYKWAAMPEDAPDSPLDIEIEFLNGIPVSAKIGREKVSGVEAIIRKLNEAGGKHGIGRFDALDEKVAGLKIREVYECPAAAILLAAHRELENLTLTTKELDVKRYVESLWGRLVHDGGWFTRLRRGLDAFIDETERAVDGTVGMRLYKGSATVRFRHSRHALYDSRLSSRDKNAMFSQKEARHFAKLYGLQDMIAYLIDVD